MSRLLQDIHPKARPQICELLATCAEQSIPVMIIFTGRTIEEQIGLYAIGRTDGQPKEKQVTWTLDSKHVMSAKQEFKSLAIDVCPFDIFSLHGPDKLQWDEKDPAWQKLGAIGEKIGLKWGVVDGSGRRKDLGHFEYTGELK